nr:PREDICTED: probable serine/threonine-protein kinase Cx32, chloroplastic [Nicotiana tabacum]
MPRYGCFNLHCIRKKCPIKNDHVEEEDDHVKEEDQLVEEECSVKNDLLDLSWEDLNLFTRQFSPENLIGLTQFGKLYRGKMSIGSDQDKITKDVAVKIMVDEMRHFDVSYDKLTRLKDELKFLQAPRFRGNPNLVKVIGCCREGRTLGIVYDLNPQDTLHNFIIRDDFKWLQRVKTALALASLLNYLHDGNSSYMLRNFDPAHIAVDQIQYCN